MLHTYLVHIQSQKLQVVWEKGAPIRQCRDKGQKTKASLLVVLECWVVGEKNVLPISLLDARVAFTDIYNAIS